MKTKTRRVLQLSMRAAIRYGFRTPRGGGGPSSSDCTKQQARLLATGLTEPKEE